MLQVYWLKIDRLLVRNIGWVLIGHETYTLVTNCDLTSKVQKNNWIFVYCSTYWWCKAQFKIYSNKSSNINDWLVDEIKLALQHGVRIYNCIPCQNLVINGHKRWMIYEAKACKVGCRWNWINSWASYPAFWYTFYQLLTPLYGNINCVGCRTCTPDALKIQMRKNVWFGEHAKSGIIYNLNFYSPL